MKTIHEEAGRYEALRDSGDFAAMAELDLLMVAEPGWAAAKSKAFAFAEELRSHKHALTQEDEFTESLRSEVWSAVVSPVGMGGPRSFQSAARQFLGPLIREIGALRAEVDGLKARA